MSASHGLASHVTVKCPELLGFSGLVAMIENQRAQREGSPLFGAATWAGSTRGNNFARGRAQIEARGERAFPERGVPLGYRGDRFAHRSRFSRRHHGPKIAPKVVFWAGGAGRAACDCAKRWAGRGVEAISRAAKRWGGREQ